MKTLKYVVLGRVQGVGFRYFALRSAARLGISGWVANRPDGKVEGEASGSAAALKEFIRVIGKGTDGAFVEKVETAEIAGKSSSSREFLIKM